jgi:Flp pilus assembly protein TadD
VSRKKEKKPAGAKATASGPTPQGSKAIRAGVAVLAAVGIAAGAYYVLGGRRNTEPLTLPQAPAAKDTVRVTAADFLGSESCAQCHAEQYAAWKGSTHGHAGGPPAPDRVIAPFDGVPMRFKDATVTPAKNGNEYRFTVAQPGRSTLVFQVDQVVGGGFMAGGGSQAFFSRFPDGTLRFLPFDYSRANRQWFCNTRSRVNRGAVPITPELSLADCADWTPSRILGSSERFQGCQQCHGSQIDVSFSGESHRYDTRFTTLAINCESCHGPGRGHVELARSGKMGQSADIGMRALETLSKDQSLAVCFQCHSVKSQLQAGYLPGKPAEQHFALKLPLVLDTVYFADGRTRTFAYQEGHLSSDCYLNGSMTCVDCHDPHSQRYRTVQGTSLPGRVDDGQCLDCHPSKAQSIERHTHHAAASAGSRCVSCHMPYLQQPEVGHQVRYARSDHTIPIPRPAFDARLGVEPACVQCHKDRSVDQLQADVTRWYGELKPRRATIDAILAADSSENAGVVAARMLATATNDPVGQFADGVRVLDRFSRTGNEHPDRRATSELEQRADSGDAELQGLALATLHFTRDDDPSVRRFIIRAAGRADGPTQAVRARWAWILKARGDLYLRSGDYRSAVASYERANAVQGDDPSILRSLGVAYARVSEFDPAIAYLKRALELNPNQSQARVDLGTTLLQRGDVAGATAAFREAVRISPVDPVGYANLGLALARGGSVSEALEPLQKAVSLDPSLAEAHFVLATAYAGLGRFQEARSQVERGLEFDPRNDQARQMLQEISSRLSTHGQ